MKQSTLEDGIRTLEVNTYKFMMLEMMYSLLLEHQKSALYWLLDQHTKQ